MKFPHLSQVAKLVLTLSQSNADEELRLLFSQKGQN